uniref:Xylanolytic transcriptional activator regulatory domain-containing protein n=1 Tax=Mycena chlorophos TaxID=658473 RepID=A0ABQ0L706_MYCCL|nr:predicted protein [Mycena chlorophos]
MGGGICSNCLSVKAECTHSRRKGTKNRSKASIQSLKSAKETVASILSPSTNTYSASTMTDSAESYRVLVEVANYARALEEQVAALQAQLLRVSQLRPESGPAGISTVSPGSPPSPGALAPVQEKHITQTPTNRSFQFVKAAIQHVPASTRPMLDLPWKRPEVWERQPWEAIIDPPPPQHTFPPDDLLLSLVDLFFHKCNPLLGLLHQASFRKSLFAERLHVRNLHFGAVVLAVCALGSRFSEDPRVLVDGTTDEHSCGWKWFAQVRPMHAAWVSVHPSTLYQLQLVILSISFLSGTAMGSREECWMLAGLGLRYAEACGLHRRHGYGYTAELSTLDAELYRRTVWMLLLFDSVISSYQGRQGRARTMQMDELDLDLPSGADEEYWGEKGAVQPADCPSKTAFTLAWIELTKILWDIQETVYPEDGLDATEEDIIALDSKLNDWAEHIPTHLQWSANLVDPIFLDQSAALYACYYHTQICLHRAFIPIPGHPVTSTAPFPSLAICANAARSCAHVLRAHADRGSKLLYFSTVVTYLFDCTLVLLVNILASPKKPQTAEEFSRATVDIQTCMGVMKLYERHLRFAGRRYDGMRAGLNLVKFAILSNSAAQALALSLPQSQTQNQRDREDSHSPRSARPGDDRASTDSPRSGSDFASTASSIGVDAPDGSGGTGRDLGFGFVNEDVPPPSMRLQPPGSAPRQHRQEHQQQQQQVFSLPLRTDQLRSFNYSSDYAPAQGIINSQPGSGAGLGYGYAAGAEETHMDLEGMFGPGVSADQLWAEATAAVAGMGDIGRGGHQPPGSRSMDTWTQFSVNGWGDWTSYMMDQQ